MAILDSGNRREFQTGAVRDIDSADKGRCDLLPLIEVSKACGDPVLREVGEFMRTGREIYIYNAITRFADEAFGNIKTAALEYSIHMSEGCEKYGERNWQKGIPCHCYIDSGVRHLLKYRRGDTDERHDRAVLWNLFGLLWTLENMPELNDLPAAEVKP